MCVCVWIGAEFDCTYAHTAPSFVDHGDGYVIIIIIISITHTHTHTIMNRNTLLNSNSLHEPRERGKIAKRNAKLKKLHWEIVFFLTYLSLVFSFLLPLCQTRRKNERIGDNEERRKKTTTIRPNTNTIFHSSSFSSHIHSIKTYRTVDMVTLFCYYFFHFFLCFPLDWYWNVCKLNADLS